MLLRGSIYGATRLSCLPLLRPCVGPLHLSFYIVKTASPTLCGEAELGSWLGWFGRGRRRRQLRRNQARRRAPGRASRFRVARKAFFTLALHTTHASDYVAECIAALERTGADNVGGPWRAESAAGGGAMQATSAAAFQSAAAAGGRRCRWSCLRE